MRAYCLHSGTIMITGKKMVRGVYFVADGDEALLRTAIAATAIKHPERRDHYSVPDLPAATETLARAAVLRLREAIQQHIQKIQFAHIGGMFAPQKEIA